MLPPADALPVVVELSVFPVALETLMPLPMVPAVTAFDPSRWAGDSESEKYGE